MTRNRELIAAHFEELDQQLRHHVAGVGLPEIHGMACGLLCAGRRDSRPSDWHALLGDTATEQAVHKVLDTVFGLGLKTLESPDLDFQPLLPADDVPISRRVESVADWCSGFMQSFLAIESSPAPGAVAEAVNDIVALAGIVPEDGEDAEARKRSLMEIEEYLRIATQLIYDETNSRDAPATQPKLH